MKGADAVFGHQGRQLLRQLDGARMGRATKGVVERQFVQLGNDGVADFPAAEAQIRAPQPADPVDHAMAVDIPDPAAIAAHDDVRRRFPGGAGMAHRMQQVTRIFGFEFCRRKFVHRRGILAGCMPEDRVPSAAQRRGGSQRVMNPGTGVITVGAPRLARTRSLLIMIGEESTSRRCRAMLKSLSLR